MPRLGGAGPDSRRRPVSRVRKAAGFIALLVAAACAPEPAQPPDTAPVGDMKQTMNWVLDPAADTIWGFAGVVITPDGETDLSPKNDEDWAKVKHAAWVIAESGNLLMMPGHAHDEADWREFSRALTAMGERAIHIAEVQDADALFEVGGHLYNVCVACHQVYARMP